MSHSHGHSHGSGHHHHHHHDSGEATSLPPALDLSVPDAELTPSQLSRRSMLRRTGLLGAGLAAGSVLAGAGQAAAAVPASSGSRSDRSGGYLWLSGDHHIHTQHSSDGKYRVIDQVRQGNAHGRSHVTQGQHSIAHGNSWVQKNKRREVG